MKQTNKQTCFVTVINIVTNITMLSMFFRANQSVNSLWNTQLYLHLFSFQISLHRSVPDTRDPRCAAVSYDAALPTTTVIIIFTNEAW